MRRLRALALPAILFAGCNQNAPAPPDVAAVPVPGAAGAPGTVRPAAVQPPAEVAAYAERVNALHAAAEKGQVSLIAQLVKGGADPNDKDDAGSTALHKAAAKNQKQAAATLIVLGADPGEKDAQGRSPVHIAAAAGQAEVLAILADGSMAMKLAGDASKGIGGLVGGDAGKGLDKLGDLVRGRANSAHSVTDSDGRTALHLAAAGGHTECIKLLLGLLTFDLFQADKSGRNVIMLAAAGGHADVLDQLFINYRLGQMTLEQLRAKDAAGQTALDLATASGKKPAIKQVQEALALVAAGAGDLEQLMASQAALGDDFRANLALEWAAGHGRSEVIRHLMALSADKPVADKRRLMGQGGPTDLNRTALITAAYAGHKEAVDALTDPKWWKDDAALAAFIQYSPSVSGGRIIGAIEAATSEKKTDILELLNARLAAAEGKKK